MGSNQVVYYELFNNFYEPWQVLKSCGFYDCGFEIVFSLWSYGKEKIEDMLVYDIDDHNIK